MYNADKARYDTEMLTYKPDPAYATQGASKKRKKDPNGIPFCLDGISAHI